MIPVDHLLSRAARALPALLVTRQQACSTFSSCGGGPRTVRPGHGSGEGSTLVPCAGSRDEIYVHGQRCRRVHGASGQHRRIPGQSWGTSGRVGFADSFVTVCFGGARDPSWRGLATLDAATRMVAANHVRRASSGGKPAVCFEDARGPREAPHSMNGAIPRATGRSSPTRIATRWQPARFCGAVLVRYETARDRARADDRRWSRS